MYFANVKLKIFYFINLNIVFVQNTTPTTESLNDYGVKCSRISQDSQKDKKVLTPRLVIYLEIIIILGADNEIIIIKF